MNTTLKDWYIVTLYQTQNDQVQNVCDVLFGTIVSDDSLCYRIGSNICTSRIIKVFSKSNMIATYDCNFYCLKGRGKNLEHHLKSSIYYVKELALNK
jgi:hypothetical protein